MKASILILSKNRIFHVKNCLASLLSTVNDPEVEVLLGDTGSDDQRVFECYEEFGKNFKGRFECVRLDHYHFSENNNALAAKAKGKYLVLLNNDTVGKPGWLENLIEPLKQPWVGCTGAKLLYGHNSRIQHAGIEFIRKGPYRNLGYHVFKNRRSGMPEANVEKYVPAVTGACLATPSHWFKSLGGLTSQYREEAQDVDYCLKLQRANLKCLYRPSSQLYHFENGTRNISEEPKDRRLFIRSWGEFIEDNFFHRKFQSIPADPKEAERRNNLRHILFERREARGDVFATTALVKAYRQENPDTHISFRTAYPDLVDNVPFIDRALGWQEYDDYPYDLTLSPTYETGEWKMHAHSFIEEMGRSIGVGIRKRNKEEYRPVFEFSEEDRTAREFYSSFAKHKKYAAISTGAGWREKEWEPLHWDRLVENLHEDGYEVFQVGAETDHRVRAARPTLNRDLHTNLAILESASFLVTVDSFPYHLGTAVGIPVFVLTCKTDLTTTLGFSNVTEIRNRNAENTPLPGCRGFGCRQKFGEGTENRCPAPILKSLTAEDVVRRIRETYAG